MSIDDIQFLKSNSFKQNYTFLIDSKDRDYLKYPNPNHYTITFTTFFRNVFGLEIVDASVPRTMYNVDIHNNTLMYYIEENKNINKTQIINNIINDTLIYSEIKIETGDFSLSQLIQTINNKILEQVKPNIELVIESISTPPDIKNKIKFISKSKHMFVLDMNKSTIRNVLGFNLTQNGSDGIYTRITDDSITQNINKFRYFISLEVNNTELIEAPGILDLIGEKYVILNCPEIEEHSTRSLSYSKHNLGLARFKLGTLGYNDENISINKTKLREFHPIGKLSKITLKFITQNGNFYDFKGANHNITFNIHYYQTNEIISFEKSILNPNYNPDILKYKMGDFSSDDDSDSDNDLDNSYEKIHDNSYKNNNSSKNEVDSNSSESNSNSSENEVAKSEDNSDTE